MDDPTLAQHLADGAASGAVNGSDAAWMLVVAALVLGARKDYARHTIVLSELTPKQALSAHLKFLRNCEGG